jgi:DNA polymerase-3 subunit beta
MDFSCQKDKLSIKATHAHGSSRFDLAMLPARDFPRIDAAQSEDEQIMLPQSLLKRLLVSTQFAMAQQDVRHYLNGILMEVKAGSLRTVATDGHRLAMATVAYDHAVADKQIIIPRKGVAELARYLSDTPEEVGITINEHFLTIKGPSFALTSKLIDHRFPDYQRALPKGGDKTIQVERELLKSCLSRAAILSNEKFRGISLHFAKDEVSVKANNPEQEVAEEKVQLDYAGPDFSIGFNVNYLLDVVNTLTTELVQFTFGDASSSVEVRGVSHDVDALYVVMPLRL